MNFDDPAKYHLGDFYLGHDTDPLRATPEFTAWRNAAPDYHALIERRLSSMVGPRTSLIYHRESQPVINLASCDYLGMASHPEVIAAQQEALSIWGNGASGPPVLSGMTVIHEALQEELSAMTGKEGTILFNSGYAAALGVCTALLHRGDVAILDERMHMSWMDGVRLSGAKLVTFAHNDPVSLEEALTRYKDSRRCVVIDGIYSMDGNFAPLSQMLDVADAHGVGVIVDEAHSVFADGPGGGGLTERLGEQQRVRVFMGTLSKAAGVIGGFISADAALIDYMRYYARPYVFSAAIPPATAAGILASVRIARKSTGLRERLMENANYMRTELQGMGLDTGLSESWVIPVIFGNRRDILFESVRQLMVRGVYAAPVDYPAVAEDQVRIRVTVSAAHSRADLDEALTHIKDLIAVPLRAAGLLRNHS